MQIPIKVAQFLKPVNTQNIGHLIPRLIFKSDAFTFSKSSMMKVQGIEPCGRKLTYVTRHVNFFASGIPVQTNDSWHRLPKLRPSSSRELAAYFQPIAVKVNLFMMRLVAFV